MDGDGRLNVVSKIQGSHPRNYNATLRSHGLNVYQNLGPAYGYGGGKYPRSLSFDLYIVHGHFWKDVGRLNHANTTKAEISKTKREQCAVLCCVGQQRSFCGCFTQAMGFEPETPGLELAWKDRVNALSIHTWSEFTFFFFLVKSCKVLVENLILSF